MVKTRTGDTLATPVVELPKRVELLGLGKRLKDISQDPKRGTATVFSSERHDTLVDRNGHAVRSLSDQALCLEAEIAGTTLDEVAARVDEELDVVTFGNREDGSEVNVGSYRFDNGFVVHVSRVLTGDAANFDATRQLSQVMVSTGWLPTEA
jgi:hypothetical protein